MNVTFVDQEKEKKVVSTRSVYVAGKKIGYIDQVQIRNRRPFHAVLEGFPGGLIQGHGNTEIEAIEEALNKNRAEAEARISEIDRLRLEIYEPGNDACDA